MLPDTGPSSRALKRPEPSSRTEAFAFFGEAVHQARRHHDVAEAHQTAEVMKGHLEFLFVFHINAHRVVFEVCIGVGVMI